MTRILLVHQPIDGGVARHVVDLFEGLSAYGYEPVLCGPGLPSASRLASSVPTDAPHARLEMGRLIDPRADLRALTGYSRIVRGLRPALVHAHSSKAGAVARAGKLLHPRIPVLHTPHGYAFAGFFERELERRVYRELERALAPLTTRVIAVCEAESRLARTICRRDRIRVVHNGIEKAAEGPADATVAGLAGPGRVICCVTQLRPGKGVETLIDALPAVLESHPDARVAIAGDGPSRDQLGQRARSLGVAHAVHFLGEHTDPTAVLRAADIFLLTSWAEAFPYVILEAMAAGLPIVASDVGGVGEAIADRQTGLLIAPRNPEATAQALSELLGDEKLRRNLGQAAQAVVAQRFNREQMVKGTAEVYEQVLRGV